MPVERHTLEPGLMLFIKKKFENGVPADEITTMLVQAGFEKEHIEEAFREVHDKFRDTHQDIVAANGFLPPLVSKEGVKTMNKDVENFPIKRSSSKTALPPRAVDTSIDVEVARREAQPLFSGRLHRHDFILGFLFFFGLGMICLIALIGLGGVLAPKHVDELFTIIGTSQGPLLLLSLPVILFPLTIMILSIIARRLHDINLPGSLALCFLVFFIAPFGVFSPLAVEALQVMLALVFVLLLAKKGEEGKNAYGRVNSLKGSFFGRIFNAVVE